MCHLNDNNRTSEHALVKSDASATASLTQKDISSYDKKILIAPSEEMNDDGLPIVINT